MVLIGKVTKGKRSKDEKNNKTNECNSNSIHGSGKYGRLHWAGSDTGKTGGTGTGGTIWRGIQGDQNRESSGLR